MGFLSVISKIACVAIACLVIMPSVGDAQAFKEKFQKHFFNVDNMFDYHRFTTIEVDGHETITAYATDGKLWVIKTDDCGIEEWSYDYEVNDPFLNFSTTPVFIMQGLDGGYVVSSGIGSCFLYLLKIDDFGTFQWLKTYEFNE